VPSRVIRGELVESQSLNRVSLEAELCFVHLVLVADDYGRADGRLDWLRARLFPCRSVAFDQLDRWLNELADEGCLRRYVFEGRPYLSLTGWERHRGKGRRAERSKYPEPPTNPKNGGSDPVNPRGSEEKQADPSEGRGSRVEGIGTRDEGRACRSATAGAEPPAPSAEVEPEQPELGVDPPKPVNGEAVGVAWIRLQAAALQHRPAAAKWMLTDARRRSLAKTLKDHPDRGLDVGAQLVAGYWIHHATWDDADKHFGPDTLLRAANRAKYLESFDEGPRRPNGATQTGARYTAKPEDTRRERAEALRQAQAESQTTPDPTCQEPGCTAIAAALDRRSKDPNTWKWKCADHFPQAEAM
jgi:hypothetical protein